MICSAKDKPSSFQDITVGENNCTVGQCCKARCNLVSIA
jgi:hypothetical protein